MTTTAVASPPEDEDRWVQLSSFQPWTNRGYYTGEYLLYGPATRAEAVEACERKCKGVPVATYTVKEQQSDGAWLVSHTFDCTD